MNDVFLMIDLILYFLVKLIILYNLWQISIESLRRCFFLGASGGWTHIVCKTILKVHVQWYTKLSLGYKHLPLLLKQQILKVLRLEWLLLFYNITEASDCSKIWLGVRVIKIFSESMCSRRVFTLQLKVLLNALGLHEVFIGWSPNSFTVLGCAPL